jgi:hypothetical protein
VAASAVEAGAPTGAVPRPLGGGMPPRRRGPPLWAAALVMVLVAGGVAAYALLGSASEPEAPAGDPFATSLRAVPTNKVSARGDATVRVSGNVAEVTVDADGLLAAAPHLMHIHAGAKGTCPPASAAKLHAGNRAITILDGAPFFGAAQLSLTLSGNTGPDSVTAFKRFTSGSRVRYRRTVRMTATLASQIRKDLAVLLVHGIDYNGNGVYDNELARSDIPTARVLPGESTAPALCGPLRAQKAAVAGGPEVFTATIAARRPARSLLCLLGGAADAVAHAARRSARVRLG